MHAVRFDATLQAVNFLAHLVLAPQTPDGWCGSIAPDMIRGPLPSDLPAEVMDAALEHQAIDQFTDTHPAFYKTRDRLRSIVNPRLAGVLTDVVYDHVLARDWSRWQGSDFVAYVTHVETYLAKRLGVLPEDARWKVQLMVDQHWMLSYPTTQGLRDRLDQMSARLTQRVGRPMSLTPSAEDLERVYPDVADDFSVIWPDLLAFVDERRQARARLHAC